jgi:hypothetical protein
MRLVREELRRTGQSEVKFTIRDILYWTLLAALIATVLGYRVRERSRVARFVDKETGEPAPVVFDGTTWPPPLDAPR